MTTAEVARQPFVMTAPDGMVSVFIPAGNDVRVYEGERGVALYLPAEVWQAVASQLGGLRPPTPSTN